MEDNIILQTYNICKQYKNQLANNNVCLTVNKGDIYGFVGRNGAGKTTIIRIVTGLATQTSGTYKLFGTEDSDSNILSVRKKISAIVENPSLYSNMTGYENLKIQCILLNKNIDIIDSILEEVGLTNDSKKVNNYSLGMRQRLSIGMSLIGNPELLILDEPMNGLDPEGIISIRNLIIKLNKEKNITFIISSHILDELSKIATKYGFIQDGKLIEEITSEELHAKCRQSIETRLNNNDNIEEVLKQMKIKEFELLADGTIKIYDKVTITELVTNFANYKKEVINIRNLDETIEDYYMHLIGGVNND